MMYRLYKIEDKVILCNCGSEFCDSEPFEDHLQSYHKIELNGDFRNQLATVSSSNDRLIIRKISAGKAQIQPETDTSRKVKSILDSIISSDSFDGMYIKEGSRFRHWLSIQMGPSHPVERSVSDIISVR